jgi:hypothetical protein
MGIPEFPQMGFSRLWGLITSRANLRLQWDLKQSCNPCRKISNSMLYVACTPGNQLNSWLLLVRSQIVSLIPGLSFNHNLYFRCPNGSCKPILNIYILISFQWYKKLFKPMGFDPYNCTLKIWESIWESNSHNGSSLESVKVHSLTLFALPKTCDVTPRPPSWPTTLQPPCLGREPKAKVVTQRA